MENESELNKPEVNELEIRESESGFKAWAKKLYSILLMIVVIICILGFGYQGIQNYRLKKERSEEQVLVQENIREILLKRSKESLLLTMKPLVWAIRSEMLRENLDQTGLYLNEMVKAPNFNLVLVVDETGTIISSTDKKFETTKFAAKFDEKYLRFDAANVELVDSSVFHIAAPIMGYDHRIGTLFVEYFPKDELNYLPPKLDSETE